MPGQPINPSTEIDMALRELKARRKQEQYERQQTSQIGEKDSSEKRRLKLGGMKEQENAQNRYMKIATPLGVGSGLSSLLYTKSGREMMQNKLGMDPATVAASQMKRMTGESAEAKQLASYLGVSEKNALSVVQNKGKYLGDVKPGLQDKGFFTNNYGNVGIKIVTPKGKTITYFLNYLDN